MFDIVYPNMKVEKIDFDDICKWKKTILLYREQ